MSIENLSQEQAKNIMCSNCKHFYGSEAYQGMCSQCFKKKSEKQQIIQTLSSLASISMENKGEKSQKKSQINCSICWVCRKKVGLLGNQCRCGMVFCNRHRLPEDHKCQFNYLKTGKEKLQKEIVKMGNIKINQI